MKRTICTVLVLCMALSLFVGAPLTASAADAADIAAADKLYTLGLFQGTGIKADGTVEYSLDRSPTRAEAITMLVRLLGKENVAQTGSWTTPFTDVPDWAKPYVGYAYNNGLTQGVSATNFGSASNSSATQYLTFVLRALGYKDGTDFQWDSAWTLTDSLGITSGQYKAGSAFDRGDVASVSFSALTRTLAGSTTTLIDTLISAGSVTIEAWEAVQGGYITLPENTSKTDVRLVVDGNVRKAKVYALNNTYYAARNDVLAILPNAQLATADYAKVGNESYYSMRSIAQTLNISYEHDSVLDSCYMWTHERYGEEAPDDYDRAVNYGLVTEALRANPDRQIKASEFRAMLTTMLQKLAPDKVGYFHANVTQYDKPLLRGEGFVMAYYAAIPLDADNENNRTFDANKALNIWDEAPYQMDQLFPNVWNGPVVLEDGTQWNDYYTAAFLWSFWHKSPYSNIMVFEYDESKASMRQGEPLTVREAAKAAARVYDSTAVSTTGDSWISLNDPSAKTYDKSIITDELLQRANALPKLTTANMPRLTGFISGQNYQSTDIAFSEADLRNISNWGFNSARLMLTYQTLFDTRVTEVNEAKLRRLDEIVAYAIEYNLLLNILTYSMPGRWSLYDSANFTSTGEFDLFTNAQRQKEANAVWALLAQRYKDIPNSVLTFSPLWETLNYDLSTGLPYKPYTDRDVAAVYDQLISTIHGYSPSRLVIYEPTANNAIDTILDESAYIKRTLESKHDNILMLTNFCENCYVYAEMTDNEGEHIDNNNHSMFKPEYPVTTYSPSKYLNRGKSLKLTGELAAGTVINVYLEETEGAGNFEIVADGKVIHSEPLTAQRYNVGDTLSYQYPYAQSDKKIQVTLSNAANSLELRYTGNRFSWSGIDVVLPARYTVQRWWYTSYYDAGLLGEDHVRPYLKGTSTINISPSYWGDGGYNITINPDVTYTADVIRDQANREAIFEWAKTLSDFAPRSAARFEDACFYLGTTVESACAYYGDILAAFKEYGFGWYSRDYENILSGGSRYANAKPVPYKNGLIEVETLKTLQAGQDVS
ncbi:MAG: glycoside hydrolase family 5 protein [Oscillospiraceae bacterium]|jgi:hypothetical protein|nr:glycoside hydrolase family 5 protein [Oscillospiraceae bacterium]